MALIERARGKHRDIIRHDCPCRTSIWMQHEVVLRRRISLCICTPSRRHLHLGLCKDDHAGSSRQQRLPRNDHPCSIGKRFLNPMVEVGASIKAINERGVPTSCGLKSPAYHARRAPVHKAIVSQPGEVSFGADLEKSRSKMTGMMHLLIIVLRASAHNPSPSTGARRLSSPFVVVCHTNI